MKRYAILLLALASCSATSGKTHEVESSLEAVRGSPRETTVVALKHAPAVELSRTLNDFIHAVAKTSASGHPGVVIVPDARTNSLVVQASPQDLPRVLDLIAQLDVQVH